MKLFLPCTVVIGAVAADDCYTLNTNGVVDGHCGNDPVAEVFIPCAQEDIKCGLMWCTGYYNYQTWEGVTPDITDYTNYVGGATCQTVSSSASLQLRQVGLIADGTTCDTGKVCKHQLYGGFIRICTSLFADMLCSAM